MGFILDIFSLTMYIPFLQVDEEDISRNAAHLKNIAGFKHYYMIKLAGTSSFIIPMFDVS